MPRRHSLFLLRCGLAALALLAAPGVASAQFAHDNAAGSQYASWDPGDNGGTGFSTWTLGCSTGDAGQCGRFTGNSTANNAGGGTSNGGTDINTAGRGWGLYANSSQTSDAVRSITTPLAVGDVIRFRMDTGNQSSGVAGVSLRNSSGSNLLEVFWNASNYVVNRSGGGSNTPVTFTRSGLEIVVTVTSATQADVQIIPQNGAAGATVTGNTFLATGPIEQFRAFNFNGGGGDDNNLFVNSLRIQRATAQDVTVTADGAAGFRQFASPVAGQTVADFASQNLVQGVSDEYPNAAKNFYTGYNGDNSANSGGTGQFGFTEPASKAEAVAPGQGVNWFLFNSAFGPLSGGTSQSYALPRTHTFTGIAQAGNVTYEPPARALGDRFYLVGNPYATSYFISSGVTLTSTSGTIGTNYEAFDKSENSYVNLATVNSGVAAVGQGFFVQMTDVAPGTFTYNANGLRDTSPTFYRKGGVEGGDLTYLGLALTGMTSTGVATNDIASALRFEADATDGWDRHDGSKISPPLAAFATIAFMGAGPNGQVEEKSNESRVGVGAGLTLPIRLSATHGGTYTLAIDAGSFPSGATVEVVDAVSGTRTDLRRANLTFTMAAAGTSDRLTLVVSPGTTTAADGASALRFAVSEAAPNPAQGSVRMRITPASAAALAVEVYDVLGRRVSTAALDGLAAGQEQTVTLDVSALPSGTYLVRVSGADGSVTRRVTVAR